MADDKKITDNRGVLGVLAKKTGLYCLCLLALACLCVAFAGPAHAQTVSASGSQAQNAMGALNAKLIVLKQQLAASQAEAAHMKTCMADRGFYNPASSEADSNGCVGEQDPQVGSLASNSLCTSDGNVVNCQPLSGSSVKVFTITQISSDHKTAVATCPNSSMRVSCAGTRSYVSGSLMTDDCTETTCGMLGIQPVGDNACRVTNGGTSGTPNPAAVAICLSLDGSGSNQVNGGAPLNCSLPWGGTLASGGSVTAYAASTVPYGQTCKSQSRSCSNGTLSGSYGYQSCSVQSAASCTLPWGGTIASGQSVTAYKRTGPIIGGSCQNETRSCNNGTLSGSYTLAACASMQQCAFVRLRGPNRQVLPGPEVCDSPCSAQGCNGLGQPSFCGLGSNGQSNICCTCYQ